MSTVKQSDLDGDLQRLAERYVATMETGDGPGYGSLFAPGAMVWLSYAGAEMPAQANAAVLTQLFDQAIDAFAFDDISWSRTSTGFLQQHLLRITAKSGSTFEKGACSVIDVTDGRITHSAEYVDSSITAFSAANGFGAG